MPDTSMNRIQALHQWYRENVMDLPITPERQRLWFEWLKAGHNGTELRDVVRYIRKQISLGKRNEGALKLSNLFERSEGNGQSTAGFTKFEEDLALARAKKDGTLSVNRALSPTPDEVNHQGTKSTQGENLISAAAKRLPTAEELAAHEEFLAERARRKNL